MGTAERGTEKGNRRGETERVRGKRAAGRGPREGVRGKGFAGRVGEVQPGSAFA